MDKKTRPYKLSIVAPMYNEAAGIALFLKETLAVLNAHIADYEVLLIDDGSTDQTIAQCLPFIHENSRVRLIAFSRNYGHEIASTAGLEYATGDYVVLMDSDLQHPPSVIPEMVRRAHEEHFDVVCAARTNRIAESWIRQKLSPWFYRLAKKMTGFDLAGETGNFRLMSRQVVDSLKQMKESNRHLVMMFAYIGYHTTTVLYECPERVAGESKYTLRKLIGLSLDSIISFSARPLHMMSILSIFISLLMVLYAGFILIEKLFTHQHLADGVASVIFLVSGLFSILFLFLAIISEYISRILVETKNRPLYYIKHDITHQNAVHFRDAPTQNAMHSRDALGIDPKCQQPLND